MTWVNDTLPPRPRDRWLLITTRLSISNFTGTDRTLVAVGTERLASMFVTTRPAAPRSTSGSTTDASALSLDGGVAASGGGVDSGVDAGVDAGVEAGVDGAGGVVGVAVVGVEELCSGAADAGAGAGAAAAAAAACGTAAGEYSTGA